MTGTGLPPTIVEKVAPGTSLEIANVPVEPEQIERGPVIEQSGTGFTVTVFVQVLEQFVAVTVVVSVNEPAAPALTVTVETVVEPTIVPLPEMAVENVAPATLLDRVKMLPAASAQTAPTPSIEQVGPGLTVTVRVQVVVQPAAAAVVVSVKLPAAPAVTLIDGPLVDPMIEPLPVIAVEN